MVIMMALISILMLLISMLIVRKLPDDKGKYEFWVFRLDLIFKFDFQI